MQQQYGEPPRRPMSYWWWIGLFIVGISLETIGGVVVGHSKGDRSSGYYGGVAMATIGSLCVLAAWITLVVWCVKRSRAKRTTVVYVNSPVGAPQPVVMPYGGPPPQPVVMPYGGPPPQPVVMPYGGPPPQPVVMPYGGPPPQPVVMPYGGPPPQPVVMPYGGSPPPPVVMPYGGPPQQPLSYMNAQPPHP